MSDMTHRPFGVEQEHFILHSDGSAPSHSEIDTLYERLKRHGFQTRGTDSNGRILSLALACEDGSLIVCNDSCTHILEVAFPVFNSLELFRNAYVETWELLKSELQPLGLRIHYGGVLDPRPEIFWRPKDTDSTYERLQRFLARPPQQSPLYNQRFPACCAATQVSLTITHPEAYRLLPSYYAFEFLSPLIFSNSAEFLGVRRHCVRPLALMQNYPDDDPLVGIPRNIPQDEHEYGQLKKRTNNRDHSFVSIRGKNRVEFRSTCSQNTVEDVIDTVQLRLAVDRAVARIDLPPSIEHSRSEFLHVAETGTLLYPQTLELLGRFLKNLDPGLPGEERLFRRIESQMKTTMIPHA